jgi:hypothetical protein
MPPAPDKESLESETPLDSTPEAPATHIRTRKTSLRKKRIVTVRPDTAETLTSRGVALVFEVEDICEATSLVQ